MAYNRNAFINCPFDSRYRKLFEVLVFTLEYYGYKTLFSETRSSAHDRLDEITKMIEDSKFSIHDLSRHRADKRGDYSRFNMPFELGIDYGCYKYKTKRSSKVIAILDSEEHAYDRYLSDMSGRDILIHNNDPELLFQLIPEWLSRSTGSVYDAPIRLKGYFVEWESDYKKTLKDRGYDLRTIGKVSLSIYRLLLRDWIETWKTANL